jgi:hypothetical protein
MLILISAKLIIRNIPSSCELTTFTVTIHPRYIYSFLTL